MIAVTRLNHVEMILNSDLIEFIENTPDTVITLSTGQKIVVLETAEVLLERIVNFRRSIASGPHRPAARPAGVRPEETSQPA